MENACVTNAQHAYSRVKNIGWRRDFPSQDGLKNLIRGMKAYRQLLGGVCEQLKLEVVSPCFDICAAIGIQGDVPPECDPRDMLVEAQVPQAIQDICFYFVKAASFQKELAARGLPSVDLYEPVIAMLESGWYFCIHHGDIDFGMATIPYARWRKGFKTE